MFFYSSLGVNPSESQSFFIKLFGWLGWFSTVFHTSVLELLNTSILELDEILPMVVNSLNRMRQKHGG